jgi:crossover junction endodeoxyribonuclease RuvC
VIVVGVDPGLSGAVAFLDAAGQVVGIEDVPTLALARGGKHKRDLDLHALLGLLTDRAPIGHAFVEQVGAMPGQGVSSVFAFGKAYGAILGLLIAVGAPLTLIAPGCAVGSRGEGRDRHRSRHLENPARRTRCPTKGSIPSKSSR